MAIRKFHLYGKTRSGEFVDLGFAYGPKGHAMSRLSACRVEKDLVEGEAWECKTLPTGSSETKAGIKTWK